MKSFIKFLLPALAILLLSLGGIYAILKWTEPERATSSQASYEYYRDSFTLLSHDSAGKPILMDMDFSRKEKDGQFIHYYKGTLWYGDATEDFKGQFYSAETEPQVHEFLTVYETEPFADLSARSTHEVSISSDAGPISFTVQTDGDFLTKDSLDYTRFSSTNPVTLSFGDEKFPAQVLWESAYSNDYTKSVFFEGRDSLDSETHLYTLWDEEGNFYHIDQTTVDGDQTNYTNHTWLLHKDAATKNTQKSFEASVLVDEKGVEIIMPEWETTILLNAPAAWDIYDSTGWIEGTVETADGELRAIEGFFLNVLH